MANRVTRVSGGNVATQGGAGADRMGVGRITIDQKWFNGDVAITHNGAGHAQLNGMQLISTDVSAEEGGHTGTTRFTYEGAVWDMAEDQYVYELDSHMGEVPIAAHPRVAWLVDKYEGISDLNSGLRFPKFLKDGKRNPLFGVTSFYDVRATWRRTYTSPTIPDAMAGRIEEPAGGAAFAAAEASTGQDSGFKYNWLRMPTRAVWKGSTWRITETWEMSGRGGWVEALYSGSCPAGKVDGKSPFKQSSVKGSGENPFKQSTVKGSTGNPFKQSSVQ
ncbi:MAG: hypothetical protein WCO60_18360 [Verrucomicrobiota bacterium]